MKHGGLDKLKKLAQGQWECPGEKWNSSLGSVAPGLESRPSSPQLLLDCEPNSPCVFSSVSDCSSGHVVGAAGICQGHPHALLILETGMPPASHPTPNPLVVDGVTSYMNSISMVSCYATVDSPRPSRLLHHDRLWYLLRKAQCGVHGQLQPPPHHHSLWDSDPVYFLWVLMASSLLLSWAHRCTVTWGGINLFQLLCVKPSAWGPFS